MIMWINVFGSCIHVPGLESVSLLSVGSGHLESSATSISLIIEFVDFSNAISFILSKNSWPFKTCL